MVTPTFSRMDDIITTRKQRDLLVVRAKMAMLAYARFPTLSQLIHTHNLTATLIDTEMRLISLEDGYRIPRKG